MQKSTLICRLIALLSLLLLSVPGASLASDPVASSPHAIEPDVPADSTRRPRGLSAASSGASNLLLVGQFGGATAAVDAVGDLVYAGIGPRLAIFDLSRPASPVLLGQTAPLPRVLESVDVQGDYAYVAAGSAGLRVIDVADPLAPVEVGSAVLLDDARHVLGYRDDEIDAVHFRRLQEGFELGLDERKPLVVQVA